THLSQAQRDEYLAACPDILGNLDGIPAAVRDEANRDNLQLLIGKLSGEDGDGARDKLEGLKLIDHQLRGAPVDKAPPMYLLGIGDEGNGRAIVSFGDPDTSRNVSAYVPGLGTKLDTDFADGVVNRARQTAVGARTFDPSTAAIVWLGYDAPQLTNLDVMSRHDAEAGAPAYNRFMAGISATNQTDNPHITAIGHSYGSLTVGLAAQQHGGIPGADDIVLVGSPGTGAKTADALGVGRDHVYVGAADNDPVTYLPNKDESKGILMGAGGGASVGGSLGLGAGPLGGLVGAGVGAIAGGAAGYFAQDGQTPKSEIYFGTDPANHEFGAHRFEVSDGPLPVLSGEGATPAHSNYFSPGKDRVSARNIALVVAGHGGEISTQEPR
ncbi:alpha/beta hydrolase, partial [Streptomyces melanogenes]|uniref:alpha/beta hydrolase n=1 Tax=Streptomyces melanogenes TaxID=67326 RepID=UPI001E45CA53